LGVVSEWAAPSWSGRQARAPGDHASGQRFGIFKLTLWANSPDDALPLPITGSSTGLGTVTGAVSGVTGGLQNGGSISTPLSGVTGG